MRTRKGRVTLPDTLGDTAKSQPIPFDVSGQVRHVDLRKMPRDLKVPPAETNVNADYHAAGTIVFYYFVTSRNVHAFAMAKDRYAFFTLSQPAKVKADMAELLKQMGLHDRSQPVAIDDLKANGWRSAGQRLLAQLTNDAKPDEWSKYRELVIVPDGVLWYLPFLLLPNNVAEFAGDRRRPGDADEKQRRRDEQRPAGGGHPRQPAALSEQ